MPTKPTQANTKSTTAKTTVTHKRAPSPRKSAPRKEEDNALSTASPVLQIGASTTTTPADTKQSRLITLIQRPEGARLDELMTVTGWQAHSVRGIISGALRKKLGLKVTLTANPDGTRVYRIAA